MCGENTAPVSVSTLGLWVAENKILFARFDRIEETTYVVSAVAFFLLLPAVQKMRLSRLLVQSLFLCSFKARAPSTLERKHSIYQFPFFFQFFQSPRASLDFERSSNPKLFFRSFFQKALASIEQGGTKTHSLTHYCEHNRLMRIKPPFFFQASTTPGAQTTHFTKTEAEETFCGEGIRKKLSGGGGAGTGKTFSPWSWFRAEIAGENLSGRHYKPSKQ